MDFIILIIVIILGGLAGIKTADYFLEKKGKAEIDAYAPSRNQLFSKPEELKKEYALVTPIESLEHALLNSTFAYRGKPYPIFTELSDVEVIINALSKDLNVEPVMVRLVESDDPYAVSSFIVRYNVPAIILKSPCSIQDIIHEFAHYLHHLEDSKGSSHGKEYIKHLMIAYTTYKELFLLNTVLGECN